MAEPSAKDRENIDRLLQSGDSRDAAKMITLIEISTQLERIAGALGTDDAHLASIAESLTQLANPTVVKTIERSQTMPDYPDERGGGPMDPPPTAARPTPSERLLNLFDQHELNPEKLSAIAGNFKEIAYTIQAITPPGPEQTVCLRHLLDAKHAAVRALITDDTPVKT